MPPRKKTPAPATMRHNLSQLVLDHILAMANDEDTIKALKLRAIDVLGVAQTMFDEGGMAEAFDQAAQNKIALASLTYKDLRSAYLEVRTTLINYLGKKVNIPALDAWEDRCERDMAKLPGAPAEQPAAAPAPAEPETLTADDLAALDRDTRAMGELQRAYGEDRDLANQLLGQTQMAQAFGQFATTVGLTKLAIVKERKLYKALAGVSGKDREGQAIEDVGTWEGYCRALGLSRSKVDEDLLNLKVFGQEAMEALSRAGAGYRELRAMRALPEGEREALAAEAARATTREELLDLLDEVQARGAAKVEELEKKAAEQAADLEARDELLKDKSARLEKKELELAKLKSLPPQENVRLKLEVEKQAVDDLNVKSIEAIAALNGLMAHVEEVMAADVSLHTRTYCEDTVRMFAETFTDLLARHGINVDFQGMAAPAWDKAAAKDDIKAGRTGA